MMTLAVDRSFECAPHAQRSLAMAFALSLNLVLVLFALLPSTPIPIRTPPPQSLLASVLQPPPPPLLPPAPTVRVERHVATPSVRVPIPHPSPVALPTLPVIAPVAPTLPATTTTTPGTDARASAGNSEATIAYETATPPAYPIQALRTGTQGTVLLKVLVDASGKPVQVVIDRSSGSPLLDAAARKHVLAAWRFHPAMRNGHAIEVWAMVPVRFNLDRM